MVSSIVLKGSPEQIAKTLFTHAPQPDNTYALIPEDDTDNDYSYLFEILITILIEGLMRLIEDLDLSLEDVNLNDFQAKNFEDMNPWFRSTGFEITVTETSQVNNDNYCLIALNHSHSYKGFFYTKSLDKLYHFFINHKYIDKHDFENMNDIFAVLALPNQNCLEFRFKKIQ